MAVATDLPTPSWDAQELQEFLSHLQLDADEKIRLTATKGSMDHVKEMSTSHVLTQVLDLGGAATRDFHRQILPHVDHEQKQRLHWLLSTEGTAAFSERLSFGVTCADVLREFNAKPSLKALLAMVPQRQADEMWSLEGGTPHTKVDYWNSESGAGLVGTALWDQSMSHTKKIRKKKNKLVSTAPMRQLQVAPETPMNAPADKAVTFTEKQPEAQKEEAVEQKAEEEEEEKPKQDIVRFTKAHLQWLNDYFSNASLEDFLTWCVMTFPNLVQLTSFGPSGLVIMDVMSRVLEKTKRKIPTVMIDTLHLFQETHDLSNACIKRYSLDLRVYRCRDAANKDEFAALFGEDLWERDESMYDYLAKVEPHMRALDELTAVAWISGRRRSQGADRNSLQLMEADYDGRIKLNPVVHWGYNEVWDHIKKLKVPYNKLHDQGYKSVGDIHSTRKTAPGQSERDGRWAGKKKTECGIHKSPKAQGLAPSGPPVVARPMVKSLKDEEHLFEFPLVMTTGGDERIVVSHQTGATHYDITMSPMAPDVVHRGSCTASPPTTASFSAAKKAHIAINKNPLAFRGITSAIKLRISKVFDLPAGTGVFLCPSGTHAEYIPVAIVRCLHPNRKICSIITCADEIGSRCAQAAGGEHVGNLTPLGGPMQDFTQVCMEGVESHIINARQSDGVPIPSSLQVRHIFNAINSTDALPLVHVVAGSKTGIYDDKVTLCEEMGMSDGHDGPGMVVVDLVQMRPEMGPETLNKEIADHLNSEIPTCVIISGSKFFEGPTFSGAVLVPPPLMDQLRETKTALPAGLSKYFSKWEVPDDLENWKEQLPDIRNLGLTLRWVAALEHIDAFNAVKKTDFDAVVQQWHAHVSGLCLNEHSAILKPLPDSLKGVFSIFTLKVKDVRHSSPYHWLSKQDLCKVRKWMLKDLSAAAVRVCHSGSGLTPTPLEMEALKVPCMMGRPVQVGQHAAIRVALGACSVLELSKDRNALKKDSLLFTKLAVLAKLFPHLEKELKDDK